MIFSFTLPLGAVAVVFLTWLNVSLMYAAYIIAIIAYCYVKWRTVAFVRKLINILKWNKLVVRFDKYSLGSLCFSIALYEWAYVLLDPQSNSLLSQHLLIVLKER